MALPSLVLLSLCFTSTKNKGWGACPLLSLNALNRYCVYDYKDPEIKARLYRREINGQVQSLSLIFTCVLAHDSFVKRRQILLAWIDSGEK